jgi:hypothetical protein
MLSFEKFWERLTGSNPQLTAASRLTLNVTELQRLLQKAYDAGVTDHRKLADDAEKLRPKSPFDVFNPFGF